MHKSNTNSCINCGYVKPKQPIDLEKDVHCSLCNITIKKKDLKEHKKKYTHLIKQEIIKKIRDLDHKNEEENGTINKIFKTLIPKYTKKGNSNIGDILE